MRYKNCFFMYSFSAILEICSVLVCCSLIFHFFCFFLLGNGVLQLVVSTGYGVNGFTLDPSLGEFILTHPDMKVKLLLNNFLYLYISLFSQNRFQKVPKGSKR